MTRGTAGSAASIKAHGDGHLDLVTDRNRLIWLLELAALSDRTHWL
jgi:hypothetical protein